MSSSARDPRAQAALASANQMWKKLESYLFRLPVLTKVVMLLIAVFHFLAVFGVPVQAYFALDPAKMNLGQMHRVNTYPLIHDGLFHAIVNLVALTPLLERFEREVGTLKTLLLVLGPLVTFPGFLYLGIEIFILKGNTVVAGASALVFTFMAMEAIKTFAFRPYYNIAGWEVPSWTTPIFWMIVIAFLAPGSSAIGHFCGLAIGYAYACRYLRLVEPSEWILAKVESKIHFLLRRIPYYISVENRAEMNYWEFLPMAGSMTGSTRGQTRGGGGESAPPTPVSDVPPAFTAAGPGVRLGS